MYERHGQVARRARKHEAMGRGLGRVCWTLGLLIITTLLPFVYKDNCTMDQLGDSVRLHEDNFLF